MYNRHLLTKINHEVYKYHKTVPTYVCKKKKKIKHTFEGHKSLCKNVSVFFVS